MVTPPELIRAISEMTGVRLATVTDIDRWLVRGNLRPVGGRGPNAARMGPQEAARLLTAVLASPQSNEAAEALLSYAHTRPDKSASSDGLFKAASLEDLAGLSAKHSFVDGLTALIASAISGSLSDLGSGRPGKPPFQIEVLAQTTAIIGRIRIAGLPDGQTANVQYVASPAGTAGIRKRGMGGGGAEKYGAGDLEELRCITQHTILGLGKLLSRK